MTGVIVTVQVKEGMDEQFKADMVKMGKLVAEKEPGYRFGDLYATNYPGKYYFLEVYEDQAALKAHEKLSHTAEFTELKKSWEENIEVHKIYPVSSSGPDERRIPGKD